MSGALAVYLPQALMLGWLLRQMTGRRSAWFWALPLAAVPLGGLPLAAHLRNTRTTVEVMATDSSVIPASSSLACAYDKPRPNRVPSLRVRPPKMVTYRSPAA